MKKIEIETDGKFFVKTQEKNYKNEFIFIPYIQIYIYSTRYIKYLLTFSFSHDFVVFTFDDFLLLYFFLRCLFLSCTTTESLQNFSIILIKIFAVSTTSRK